MDLAVLGPGGGGGGGFFGSQCGFGSVIMNLPYLVPEESCSGGGKKGSLDCPSFSSVDSEVRQYRLIGARVKKKVGRFTSRNVKGQCFIPGGT